MGGLMPDVIRVMLVRVMLALCIGVAGSSQQSKSVTKDESNVCGWCRLQDLGCSSSWSPLAFIRASALIELNTLSRYGLQNAVGLDSVVTRRQEENAQQKAGIW